jgi:hypothetical protein
VRPPNRASPMRGSAIVLGTCGAVQRCRSLPPHRASPVRRSRWHLRRSERHMHPGPWAWKRPVGNLLLKRAVTPPGKSAAQDRGDFTC